MLESAHPNLAGELNARAQAESALQKYADQLADLYNNAPCGYHSLDPDGVFVQINDNELAWLCRPRREGGGQEGVVGPPAAPGGRGARPRSASACCSSRRARVSMAWTRPGAAPSSTTPP